MGNTSLIESSFLALNAGEGIMSLNLSLLLALHFADRCYKSFFESLGVGVAGEVRVRYVREGHYFLFGFRIPVSRK